MSLRRLLGIFVALAVLSIASGATAVGALAHGAHAHPTAVTPASFQLLVDVGQASAAGWVATDEDNLTLPAANRDAHNDRLPAPCYDHCCGIAGLSCCGLTQHPIWLAALCDSGAGKVIAVNDRRPEGLGPYSILRPPRTIA